MKHYYARQQTDGYRWEFVVDDDGLIYSVGYCSGAPDFDDPALIESLGGKGSEAYRWYRFRVEPWISRYHKNGHDSKDEACACFRMYLLDYHTDFSVELGQMCECMICAQPTHLGAMVYGQAYVLCDQHRNRDELNGLMPVLLELFV